MKWIRSYTRHNEKKNEWGLKSLGKLVPQGREKRNKRLEISSAPGFWEFNKKRVTGRLCAPCRNLGDRTKRAEGAIIQRGHQPVCNVKATGIDTQHRCGKSQLF